MPTGSSSACPRRRHRAVIWNSRTCRRTRRPRAPIAPKMLPVTSRCPGPRTSLGARGVRRRSALTALRPRMRGGCRLLRRGCRLSAEARFPRVESGEPSERPARLCAETACARFILTTCVSSRPLPKTARAAWKRQLGMLAKQSRGSHSRGTPWQLPTTPTPPPKQCRRSRQATLSQGERGASCLSGALPTWLPTTHRRIAQGKAPNDTHKHSRRRHRGAMMKPSHATRPPPQQSADHACYGRQLTTRSNMHSLLRPPHTTGPSFLKPPPAPELSTRMLRACFGVNGEPCGQLPRPRCG